MIKRRCDDSPMQPTSGVSRRSGWVALAGTVGVLGLLWVVLVAAPPWFVHDRSLEGLKAQNAVRTTLLQGLGGVVLLVGAYFTYRQVRIGLEQLELARQQAQRSDERVREQLQIAQQGQITERFTRAIDQLGHTQLDVRLGGIYALERIARDSSADRATIGEVLTAFVRSHAPWPPRLPGQYVAAAPIDEVPELQVRAADVQACLTVLGRGGFARAAQDQRDRLDLHAVDLRHADLTARTWSGRASGTRTWRGRTSATRTWRGRSSPTRTWRERPWRGRSFAARTCRGRWLTNVPSGLRSSTGARPASPLLGRTPQPTSHDRL
jgi:hypothetical protein